MPPGVFTRSVGMRLAIVGTAHLHTALAPWRREPRVAEFLHRTRKELAVAA
ncbi:hypothetical protein OG500_03660 [Kitasatospora sp. NBC_01250]|uniref:hypothetical protein n=1 Tax=Kitasatospora sp. NBC_01250 TaxID=2903571 RepID=UPI002E33E1EE|nr:hypothetical protein [Kitasatospora sp. NBC_01250]